MSSHSQRFFRSPREYILAAPVGTSLLETAHALDRVLESCAMSAARINVLSTAFTDEHGILARVREEARQIMTDASELRLGLLRRMYEAAVEMVATEAPKQLQ